MVTPLWPQSQSVPPSDTHTHFDCALLIKPLKSRTYTIKYNPIDQDILHIQHVYKLGKHKEINNKKTKIK